jgi:hypothetical protein
LIDRYGGGTEYYIKESLLAAVQLTQFLAQLFLQTGVFITAVHHEEPSQQVYVGVFNKTLIT